MKFFHLISNYRQAKHDQKIADYPGCALGLMECRSSTCGCDGKKPDRAFVRARMRAV